MQADLDGPVKHSLLCASSKTDVLVRPTLLLLQLFYSILSATSDIRVRPML